MLGLGTELPTYEAKYWTGAVGANTSLLRNGRCPRVIHVVVSGDLVLTRDAESGSSANITFSAADIAARQGVIYCGGYSALVATGSTAHTLIVGW